MVKKNNKRKTLKRKKIGGASPASSEELDQYTRPISQTGNSTIRNIGTAISSPDLPTFITEQINNNAIQPVARHDSNEERERRLEEELFQLRIQIINLISEINRIKEEIKRIQGTNKRQRTR